MGFSLSWIAVCGKPVEEVLLGLGLRGTGIRRSEAPFLGVTLPSGCYLVIADYDMTFFDDRLLVRLSVGCEIVTCAVEEHVSYSSAAEWKDGRRVWNIEHDAQRGVTHLATEGDLPAVFRPIHDRLCAAQAAQDGEAADTRFLSGLPTDFIFDIPVEVAAALTGYRYDVDALGLSDDAFEVLVKEEAAGRREGRWLRRWD